MVFLSINIYYIQKLSVRECICYVGQIFVAVKVPDSHLNSVVSLDFILVQYLAPYKR